MRHPRFARSDPYVLPTEKGVGFYGSMDHRRGTAGAQIPGTRRLLEDTDGHQGAAI